jgi:hypothetical protein
MTTAVQTACARCDVEGAGADREIYEGISRASRSNGQGLGA